MKDTYKIHSALISVYHKHNLDELAKTLDRLGVRIYSTGGTARFIRALGIEVVEVADLTGYPSILGGRVKTLHPKVHGGILARRNEESDVQELGQYEIPPIDLVIVDLYPFEETVKSGASQAEIIEKIDIGGIALIRAAAKNYEHVTVVPSQEYYATLLQTLEEHEGGINLQMRKYFAAQAFRVSSHYDTQIFQYMSPEAEVLKISENQRIQLRYGENPHQKGFFYGDIESHFEQLNGKALSYNNLVDIDAILQIVDDFEEPFFAVVKHTNPCGCAIGTDLYEAWTKALECDPLSAFGGILACNGTVTKQIAESMRKLFFEVLIANDFEEDALEILRKKKKRILLKRKPQTLPNRIVKSALNGYIVQDRDTLVVKQEDMVCKTTRTPLDTEWKDILFGEKVIKHLKSNAIGIVKHQQLIGSGIGQTSRVDAVKQAIQKAIDKGFSLENATLVSDAFFPFADSVKLAFEAGITLVMEPGGSIRDQKTIDFCENNNMCLILTGNRHFKH